LTILKFRQTHSNILSILKILNLCLFSLAVFVVEVFAFLRGYSGCKLEGPAVLPSSSRNWRLIFPNLVNLIFVAKSSFWVNRSRGSADKKKREKVR
jgi:hypothetical protein